MRVPHRPNTHQALEYSRIEFITPMLWLSGSLLLVCWLIAKFLLHKSGMWHLFLMAAAILFVIQFIQDRRTKEHEKSFES